MLRTVIFDLDDTLVDQKTAAQSAVVVWAQEHGLVGPEVVERWAAISNAHYERYQAREITFAEQRRVRTREFLDIDVDDEQADALFAGYLERYEAGWTTFDDAVPALRRARDQGLTVAILTNGDHDHQTVKLERLGLAGEVDVLIASSTLAAGKPDPRAFTETLSRIGVAAEQALMVGDSLENDVEGALGAGVAAVLLDRYDEHPDAGHPRVRTLADLDFCRVS